jgi:hypothetical protein
MLLTWLQLCLRISGPARGNAATQAVVAQTGVPSHCVLQLESVQRSWPQRWNWWLRLMTRERKEGFYRPCGSLSPSTPAPQNSELSERKAAERQLPRILRRPMRLPGLLRCLLACLAEWQLRPAAGKSSITRRTVRTDAHLACASGHTKEGGVWQLRPEAAQHGHLGPRQHTVLVDSLRDVKMWILLTIVLS